MHKLLTIAIPTYNRAQLLDKQLAWLAQDIKGFESECEIIISDNGSTDNTQDILEKYQADFSNTTFHSNRNSENLGVMKNVVYCMNTASSKYLWKVGDDDKVRSGTVSYLLKRLKESSELSLLILNYSSSTVTTGELIYERCYAIETEEVRSDGIAVFANCVKENVGGVGFISALVCRTEFLQRALTMWPDSLNNMEAQVYWTAVCAASGSVIVTKDTFIDNVFGDSYWMREPKVLLKTQYVDLPTVYLKLLEIGYPKKFCRQMILKHFGENNWRVFLGALRKWPLLAVKVIVFYLSVVYISVWEILLGEVDRT